MVEIWFILLLLAGIGGLVLMTRLVWIQTKRKAGIWGFNFRRVNCPKCYHPTPFARKPTSVRQALWGGWTCSECGTEIDKWGTDISSLVRITNSEQVKELPEQKSERSPLERVFDENNVEKE